MIIIIISDTQFTITGCVRACFGLWVRWNNPVVYELGIALSVSKIITYCAFFLCSEKIPFKVHSHESIGSIDRVNDMNS